MKLVCILILLAGTRLGAAPMLFQSAESQTSLLELYTSEGCSSCPSAEAWLSQLTNNSDLWRGFVPVAFHVDYWNGLGWRDKLSDESYSERQRHYAQLWSAENIYTPEFVFNGKEWRNWLGLRSAPAATATLAGKLRVRSADGKHWLVDFIPTENRAADYEVTAALLVCGLNSDITAGENSGRHLNHDFAALSLIIHPLTSQTNGLAGRFIIDPAPKGVAGRLALAVWVTRSGQLAPLQATGGWLIAPGKINLSSDHQTINTCEK